MANPWEKYASQPSREVAQVSAPWEKYGQSQQPIQEEPGLLSTIGTGIMDGLSAAGEFVDSYSGAPTRAAINTLVQGQGGGAAAEAFYDQFGSNPNLAPTGKEIAANAGLSTENKIIPRNPLAVADEQRAFNRQNVPTTSEVVSPAGMAGLAIDVGADPLNFIPIGMMAKGGAKLTGKAVTGGAKYALKGTVAAADAALDTTVVSRTATDAARAMDNVVSTLKKSFNPERAEDFQNFVEVAKKHGIDPDVLPETVEFGPQSSITKKSKTIAEGPGGESIQKRYRRAQNEVAVALDNQVRKLGGGEKLLDSEAGEMLVNAYNKGVKSFFDQDMMTHAKVVAQHPGIQLNQDAVKAIQSKVRGLKNKATGRSRRGFGGQREEAQSFLADADIVEKSLDKHGNLSYKRASELLTNLGEEAFKKYPAGTKIPTDQKALREMYFTVRDAMLESAGHSLGQDVATEMAMNNQIISSFLKDKGAISKIFEGDAAPEKIIRSMVESGDTKKINALKEILSPEDFQKFKGVVANKFIKQNAEGNILYRTTLNNLERNKEIVSAVFQPEEIAELAEVIHLGDRVGDFIFNTSNTNTAQRFSGVKNFANELIGSAYDEVTLERLKDIARGKAAPVEAATGQAKTGNTATRTATGTTLKQLPLFQSKSRAALEGGRISSLQDRNKEAEKRKRAISGSK